jgi:hypothetical protein
MQTLQTGSRNLPKGRRLRLSDSSVAGAAITFLGYERFWHSGQ